MVLKGWSTWCDENSLENSKVWWKSHNLIFFSLKPPSLPPKKTDSNIKNTNKDSIK